MLSLAPHPPIPPTRPLVSPQAPRPPPLVFLARRLIAFSSSAWKKLRKQPARRQGNAEVTPPRTLLGDAQDVANRLPRGQGQWRCRGSRRFCSPTLPEPNLPPTRAGVSCLVHVCATWRMSQESDGTAGCQGPGGTEELPAGACPLPPPATGPCSCPLPRRAGRSPPENLEDREEPGGRRREKAGCVEWLRPVRQKIWDGIESKKPLRGPACPLMS